MLGIVVAELLQAQAGFTTNGIKALKNDAATKSIKHKLPQHTTCQ